MDSLYIEETCPWCKQSIMVCDVAGDCEHCGQPYKIEMRIRKYYPPLDGAMLREQLKTTSIRALARRLGTTPPRVSRWARKDESS